MDTSVPTMPNEAIQPNHTIMSIPDADSAPSAGTAPLSASVVIMRTLHSERDNVKPPHGPRTVEGEYPTEQVPVLSPEIGDTTVQAIGILVRTAIPVGPVISHAETA